MAKRHQPKWREYETLLLVGEGDSEHAFLHHAKALFVQRGDGLQVKIANAHGKGAGNVIDVAIRQRANAAYDHVAVLLDTDTGWTPAVMKRAQEHNIHVMCSTPMFEAMMLRIHGHHTEGAPNRLKKRFTEFIQNDGYQAEHYEKHYGPDILQRAAATEEAIRLLLLLLRVNLDGL